METAMMSLWLPIVLAGVALFFASWLAWMALPHHKGEWKGLPDENAVLTSLKRANVSAGQYMFPYAATSDEWKTDTFKAKQVDGPTGTITLWDGAPNMGRNMLLTLIYFLVVSFTIAYLAAMVIPPTDNRWFVFRFVGTAGILVYAAANILNGIWFGRKVIADIVDGVVYGLITGAVFAWLWPAAAAAENVVSKLTT